MESKASLMVLQYATCVDGHTQLWAKMQKHKLYVGDLTHGLTEALKKKILKAEEKLLELNSESCFSLNKVFNKKGRPRNVVIVSGNWKLNFGGRSKTIKIRHETRSADIAYLTLKVCMHYGIDENSVDAMIIRHSIAAMA